VSFVENRNEEKIIVSSDRSVELITVHPNLNNIVMKNKFMQLVSNNLNSFIGLPISDVNNKQKIIDDMYYQLTSSIINAYKECSQIMSKKNKFIKSKNWFTSELRELKEKMFFLRHDNMISNASEIKVLKKRFKKIMKKNINMYEKNGLYNIENLIKEKNSEKFFKKISILKEKNKENIDININDLVSHYSSIFNESIKVAQDVKDKIMHEISDINIKNYDAITLTLSELELAYKQTKISKVCGNDLISSHMLLNCNEDFLKSKVLFFYKYIFHHGVIPSELNITHIIPIIKDKKKPNNSLNNLRPISISNTLAQIFERILINKMPQLNQTHQNQFGYKKKISCTHALFAFKETIIKYIEEKKHIFAVSLDAVKAFDKVWREALFYKLKKLKININLIILLRIYYDKLASKIKLGSFLSVLFKLLRGLKQGGVLSGALFNTFIDDLI
jgi:hypothetical protein